MGLYEKIANLEIDVESCRLDPLEKNTKGGWKRGTTLVRLTGGGCEGVGEDVTYNNADHERFQGRAREIRLAGHYTLDDFSQGLDRLDVFTREPLFRRWAFESAACDLALRQAGLSLAQAIDREPRPVHYVISLGLGNPPGTGPLDRVLKDYPSARFKIDLAPQWNRPLVKVLARTGRITTVDLKGHYHGDFEGPPANAAQYREVAEGLREAWIEDPVLNDETRPALEPFRDRITWDAVLHSVADIARLPFVPTAINMKPSRFGFFSELLRAYEYCENRGIAMYGGGQFEIGAGRGQVQYLASLFHADGANDVSPPAFNDTALPQGLPASPLSPAPSPAGFAWNDGTR